MSELHILDAGRADCTVLLLDTPQGRQTVVVDGGGKYYGARRPLLEFLTQRNISDIDLLILTHLHQDHFGGFVHLVDQVQVRRAVAPCRDLQFADRVYPVFGDQEFYREYHTFFQSEPQRDRTDPVERVRRKDLYLRRLRAGLPLPHAGQYAAVGDLCGGPVCA